MAFPHYRLDIIERGGARKDLDLLYIYMIDRADRCLNKRTISTTLLANYDLSNTRVVFYTVSECKYVYIYVCVVSYSQQQLQSMTTSFFPHLAVMYLWTEIFFWKKT